MWVAFWLSYFEQSKYRKQGQSCMGNVEYSKYHENVFNFRGFFQWNEWGVTTQLHTKNQLDQIIRTDFGTNFILLNNMAMKIFKFHKNKNSYKTTSNDLIKLNFFMDIYLGISQSLTFSTRKFSQNQKFFLPRLCYYILKIKIQL